MWRGVVRCVAVGEALYKSLYWVLLLVAYGRVGTEKLQVRVLWKPQEEIKCVLTSVIMWWGPSFVPHLCFNALSTAVYF